ncbi:MAG: FTR1 family protein [Nitrososphaeraceae archaeon]
MKIKTRTSNNSNWARHKKCQISSFIIAFLLLSNILIVYFLLKNPAIALSFRSGIELRPILAAAYTSAVSGKSKGAINDTDAIILMTNFDRIRTQLMLTEQSLTSGDGNMAFAHSYITHSVIFPSIKNILENTGYANSASQLESGLTDITFSIKTGDLGTVKRNLVDARSDLNKIYIQILNPILKTDKRNILFAQTAALLLVDANRSYQLSKVDQSKSTNKAVGQVSSVSNANKYYNTNGAKRNVGGTDIDYQNAVGLVHVSQLNYGNMSSSLNSNKNSEIRLAYIQLTNYVVKRSDKQTVSGVISELENDLAPGLTSSSTISDKTNVNSVGSSTTTSTKNQPQDQNAQYFSTIRTDLANAIAYIKARNYAQADDTVVTAYLDNFEYLEPPIDKYDHKLKIDIELAMREHLREMISKKAPPGEVSAYVNGILQNLKKAESLIKDKSQVESTISGDGSNNNKLSAQTLQSLNTGGSNGKRLTDIQALSKGFGVYTGDRRSIGQADESFKGIVRNDVDKIGSKLDDMLSIFKKGNYDEAFSTSRSAYLDNYEHVEVPLRPINPDFTLDMEIKFAELRNLIQTKVPYDKIQSKVFEIKQGLDESERLVSGTGVVAPGIAFSTSFSIIFREGLESALIIGAVLTYLEASRNNKFKKHVYYGIIIAIAATAATWSIAQYIIEISGANREIIEAVAGISAVAVLFWVSFWVLNKIETKKWIEFVKAKVWKATTTGSVIVFVMLSFFTVYREGFETVLFYQAILSFAKYMEWYVIAGLISGLAVIIGIVFLIRRLGKKLPLRVLFGLTMGVGAYMSIAFMGNAIRSFQELGYISTTSLIGTVPRLDINLAEMTGIHPTLESVIAQLILLAIYVIGSTYVLVIKPRKTKAIESARKSMADIEKK